MYERGPISQKPIFCCPSLTISSFLSQKSVSAAHGTFIGAIQLESQKPTQVQVDSVIRFGASTRSYVLREKPALPSTAAKPADNPESLQDETEEGSKGGLLGLPESDSELDVSFLIV